MKLKNFFKSAVTLSLAACMTIGFAACTPEETPPVDDNPPEVPKVQISIGETTDKVYKGDSVNLSVTVTGAEDTTYSWEYDSAQVLINNDVMMVIKEATVDEIITITAVANADNTVKASRSFTLKASTASGQVGALTSAMIEEIAVPQIKVTGVLEDIYHHYTQTANDRSNKYDFSVTMEDGAWSGTWNIQGNTYNILNDIYRKGEEEATNANGVSGHVLKQMYVDKNNQVASKTIKDYRSVPAVWEAQHLWNHLGNLNVNTFVHDTAKDVYTHNVDVENESDLYLMTYLSYSLTPMLEDTLDSISFKVEDGHITKLIAQTEPIYYNVTEENKTGDSMSYTEIELTFSEIGTATVADPVPFEAPEYAELLTAALEKMGNADNYTFDAEDTTTYAPETDAGDYEGGISELAAPSTTYKVGNSITAVGKVGSVGKVTKDAILVARTTKYNYSMDGNNYRTEYTGTRQFDGYYEEFAYDGKLADGAGAMYGTRKVVGNIFDSMPTFDFSANIFKWDGSSRNSLGKLVHRFVLRDTAITRDVAMEVSSYAYAPDASASSTNTLTIVVDEDGNLISTTYPYSLTYGTYLGYVNTTYYNIGTTTLDADLFDGYEARKVISVWGDASINYRPSHSTQGPDNMVSGDVVIDAFFGDFAQYVPDPQLFVDLFGDNLSNSKHWADWRDKGEDADGNTTYIDYISFNAQYMDYDENRQLNNWDKLADDIDAAMLKEGFQISKANTDRNGSMSSTKNRYLTYTKTNNDGDGIMVVYENMGTSFIYIYIYKVGDWQLSTRA